MEFIPHAVTVRELAVAMDQAHTPNDAFADYFLRPHGHVVGVDWKGEAAVSEKTAHLVREAHYAARDAERLLRDEYSNYVGARNERRQQYAMKKHDQVFTDYIAVKKDRRPFGLPLGSGSTRYTVGAGLKEIDAVGIRDRKLEDAEAAREAYNAKVEAYGEFDRREPEQSYEEWVKRNAKKARRSENE
jgi:hypothetical protein